MKLLEVATLAYLVAYLNSEVAHLTRHIAAETLRTCTNAPSRTPTMHTYMHTPVHINACMSTHRHTLTHDHMHLFNKFTNID